LTNCETLMEAFNPLYFAGSCILISEVGSIWDLQVCLLICIPKSYPGSCLLLTLLSADIKVEYKNGIASACRTCKCLQNFNGKHVVFGITWYTAVQPVIMCDFMFINHGLAVYVFVAEVNNKKLAENVSSTKFLFNPFIAIVNQCMSEVRHAF
jgi:hypothetical protein